MKRNLLSTLLMVVAATPVFAQSTSVPTIVESTPELSTVSLIAAGIVALGIARRKTEKITKSQKRKAVTGSIA